MADETPKAIMYALMMVVLFTLAMFIVNEISTFKFTMWASVTMLMFFVSFTRWKTYENE